MYVYQYLLSPLLVFLSLQQFDPVLTAPRFLCRSRLDNKRIPLRTGWLATGMLATGVGVQWCCNRRPAAVGRRQEQLQLREALPVAGAPLRYSPME